MMNIINPFDHYRISITDKGTNGAIKKKIFKNIK